MQDVGLWIPNEGFWVEDPRARILMQNSAVIVAAAAATAAAAVALHIAHSVLLCDGGGGGGGGGDACGYGSNDCVGSRKELNEIQKSHFWKLFPTGGTL